MSIWFKHDKQIVCILLVVLGFAGCQESADNSTTETKNQQDNIDENSGTETPPQNDTLPQDNTPPQDDTPPQDSTPTSITISNTTPMTYQWTTLDVNAKLYIDRDYVYTNIPTSYQGLQVLQTANDDKQNTALISFDIDQEADVYVAHYSPDVAQWLDSWTFTGDFVETTGHTLTVYKRYFPVGTVELGSNFDPIVNSTNASSMYVVFVDHYKDSTPGQYTGTATLSWTPPMDNDLAGYKIYYGNTPGNYPFSINVPSPGISSYVVENLAPNTYHFVVTAYDTTNNESAPSNMASKTISSQ